VSSSANAASLRVRISADLADIKQGLAVLRGDLSSLKKTAEASIPSLGGWTGGLKAVRNQVLGLAAAYASIASLHTLGDMADEATALRGRVRSAKGDYEGILKVAQDTRTGLTSTVDLYARMERSTRSQGLSQQRLLKLTNSVNQAIKLSYTSTGAGEAAVMQFGQALASGTLRGDELNSVLEQTPRLAEAIASGLGISVGQLKQFAQQGKLTTDVLIKALESQSGVLEKEFAAMPQTIGDAMTQLRNAFLDYVGDVDQSTGASQQFAAAIRKVASDLPRYLDPLLAVSAKLVENFDTLAVAVGTYFAVQAVAAAVSGVTALIRGLAALRTAIVAAELSAVGLRAALATMGGPITLAIAALTAGIYYLYQRTQDAKRAAEEHTAALEANKNMALASRDAALADAKAKRQQAADTLKAARAAFEEARYKSQAVGTDIGGGGPMGMPRASMGDADGNVQAMRGAMLSAAQQLDDWDKQIKALESATVDSVGKTAAAAVTGTGKAIAASNALTRDEVQRQLKALDQMYADHLVGIKSYYAQREQLQKRAIDLEIEQARAELAVTAAKNGANGQDSSTVLEKRRSLEEKILTLQRDRAEIGVSGAREQKAAEEELAKSLEEIYVRQLEQQGKLAAARRAELEAQYKDLKAKLLAGGDLDGVARVNLYIDTQIARTQLDQFATQASATASQLRAEESAVSAQMEAGTLGYVQGEQRLEAIRQQARATLAKLLADQRAYLATLDPSSSEYAQAFTGMAQIQTDLANIDASLNQTRQGFEDSGYNAVTKFLTNLREGSMTAADAFRQLVADFAAGVADMYSQTLGKQAISAVSSLFGASGDASADAAATAATTATAAATAGTALTTASASAASILTTAGTTLAATIVAAAQSAAATLAAANSTSILGAAHAGGVAGSFTMFRSGINPAIFAGAPRYHTGGVAGLTSKEVPAILERGETIRTRQQERALQARQADGQGSRRVTTPIVAIGDDAVANAMAGAAGEDVVLTHVRNNWGGLSRG
jgi:tape measure domain-containing protein